MLQAIPIILGDGAWRTYSDKSGDCARYVEAVQLLQSWYNFPEKHRRILTAWQTMSLSQEMDTKPESGEVDVFRDFVKRLRSLQKQLETRYHGDQFLRHRLLTAVDILNIKIALNDCMPRTSQEVTNRTTSKLSYKPMTAGHPHQPT